MTEFVARGDLSVAAELAAFVEADLLAGSGIAPETFWTGFDDAIYAAVRVITQMVKGGQSVTEFMDSLPEQHATPEIRIDCPDTVKFDSMEKIRAHVLYGHDAANVNSIDGVRVRSGDGWWLIRASNTEAALVARAEAADRAALDRLLGDIETTLAAAGLDWTRS